MASSASIASMTAAPTAARFPRRRRRPSRARTGAEPKACASLMPHPWIQPTISEVRGEVEEERQRAVEHDHAHDERVVAIEGALDHVPPRAGQREDRLHHE